MGIAEPTAPADVAAARATLDDHEETLREALQRLETRVRDEISIGPKIAATLEEHVELFVIGGWLLGYWLGRRPPRLPR